MFKRKLLFSIFNIAARTYSSQIVTVNSRKHIFKHLSQLRPQSTSCTPIKKMASGRIANYEEVKAVKDDKNILLIDVREPQELTDTGVIPGSINIPLGEVETVLRDMQNENFKQKYGRDKPDKNFSIIFSCRSGKRSDAAMQQALNLGYCNVRSYGGGWLDWEKQMGL